jgi:broad specificity phosphatase PhoE
VTDVYFITHPDVVKDPDVPVPRWPLSARGRERMAALLARPWVGGIGAIYCSDEQKALDGAAILAGHLGLTPLVAPELGEVDRSSTGYLPEEEHAAAARLLFERPDESVRGWETARHAQARIIAAIEAVLEHAREQGSEGAGGRGDIAIYLLETEFLGRNSVSMGNIAIVAQGAVGTFYLCHLKGVPISMADAQPGRDGGHYFWFDAETKALKGGWMRIEPE